MYNEGGLKKVEAHTWLQCAVVTCRQGVNLFYVTYECDEQGNTVPPDLKGPYFNHRFDLGPDYKFLREGASHELYEYKGKIRVKRYRPVFPVNDFAHGCPLLPKYGYTVGCVVWICPRCKENIQWLIRTLDHPRSRYHQRIIEIAFEAAGYEKRHQEELDRDLF